MTMPTEMLKLFGYDQAHVQNDYYTALIAPGIGVTVALMASQWMVQFFPWGDDNVRTPSSPISPRTGHEHYANFITSKATSHKAAKGELFEKWIFLSCSTDVDLLTLKCLIEEGRSQMEKRNAEHQAR